MQIIALTSIPSTVLLPWGRQINLFTTLSNAYYILPSFPLLLIFSSGTLMSSMTLVLALNDYPGTRWMLCKALEHMPFWTSLCFEQKVFETATELSFCSIYSRNGLQFYSKCLILSLNPSVDGIFWSQQNILKWNATVIESLQRDNVTRIAESTLKNCMKFIVMCFYMDLSFHPMSKERNALNEVPCSEKSRNLARALSNRDTALLGLAI